MKEKILIVDDEPNILAACRRQLRKFFDLHTAQGALEAQELIREQGPYSVVVSDMRMPEMDGIEFLSWVHERSPDSVRMMLTGNADLETATRAVNQGNIFRFLTKPCSLEKLAQAIWAGIRQYRLITAERVLLERTLRESLRVLTEVLGLVNPQAFSRSSRILNFVRQLVKELDLPDHWEFEVAGMLCQLGCVSLPAETLERVYSGEELSEREAELYRNHPSVAADLLSKIPRLERVARMIEAQRDAFSAYDPSRMSAEETREMMGAQILKAALQLDHSISQGVSPALALRQLQKRVEEIHPAIIEAATRLNLEKVHRIVKRLHLAELQIGMILDEDVFATSNLLLVSKGQEVSQAVLERLRAFSKTIGIREPFRVVTHEEAKPLSDGDNIVEIPVSTEVVIQNI